jgi:hypothetical protein
MMNKELVFAAIIVFVATVRIIVTGSGSPSGTEFRRDEDPALFWLIVFGAICGDAFLFYKAFSGGW